VGAGAEVVRAFITPAPLTKTPAALLGGLSLFLFFIGWHRHRRPKKR
jgi:hypothetical protein